MLYLTIKALHIVGVISWMAGLLYLPRFFVYHSMSELGSSNSDIFKIMEARLIRFIMFPAMFFVWITGVYLAIYFNYYSNIWFLVKFILVIFLTGAHFYMNYFVAVFANDGRPNNHGFFRKFNEVPTVLMILIVFLVVLKPF